MLTYLLPTTAILLATLAALTACTSATPAPSITGAPTLSDVAATPVLLPDTQEPVATAAPVPMETPNVAPTPTSQPTPEPAANPQSGRLAPIRLQDSQALVSSLSQAELACIGDVPETLDRVREWPSRESKDEMLRLIGCLGNETLARLFLSGLVAGPEPLSPETSDCVRAAFAIIDPKEVMTAGIEDDPVIAGRAIAASTAAATTVTACLADEEWERANPTMEMGPQDRASQRCLLATLGGPGEMAKAMTAAGEGDFAALAGAGEECGVDIEPPPGQAQTGEGPAPTPVALPTQVNQAPSQAQDIPALTDDQVAKMKESISGDPLLTVMLQGGYTINDYGPWVVGDRTFIGAIAEIFLTTPTDYQGRLPMVGFEPAEDGSKEYISETVNITASGIRSLIILVDIAEEEVVGIEIGESDTLNFPPTENRRGGGLRRMISTGGTR